MSYLRDMLGLISQSVALTKIAAFRGGKPGDRVTTHDGLFTQRPLQLDWKHYVFVTDSKWEGSDDTLKRIVSTVVGVQFSKFSTW